MAEDYDRASGDYARIRQPVGLEILLGIFAQHLGETADRDLVDIGTGPGNYAVRLAPRFRSVAGIDSSPEQIINARRQAEATAFGDRLSFTEGTATGLPFADESFDAALMSLMIHHNPPSDHPRMIGEIARVLRPQGVAVFGVCTREQIFHGAWYCSLIPEACEKSALRHPDVDGLEAIAAEHGLRAVGRFVPVDALLQGDEYFRALGPSEQSWRFSDSIFSLLSDEQTEDLERRVTAMHAAGTLEDYMIEADRARKGIGQVTFIALTRD